MNPDLTEWQSTLRSKLEERQRTVLPHAHTLRAAAVSMNLLTNDEHWDRYLSLLQGMRETVVARKADAERKQSDPAIWAPEALYKLKADVLQAEAMLAAIDTIMALPKALRDGGEKAQEMINKFERADEATEQPQP
jgi:hypothetical protein